MSEESDNTKMRAFRKLRQIVAAAAMQGYETVLPRDEETGREWRERSVAQGTVIAKWLGDKFPDMGVAVAAQRLCALMDSMKAGEYGSDASPGYRAADAVCDVLECFVLTAPAGTVEDASARVTYWFDWLAKNGEPAEAGANAVAERIRGDFRSLAAGTSANDAARTIAGWRYRDPFHGGSHD